MAGKTGVTIRIVSNRLPEMPALIRTAVANEVGKAAYDIEAKAKAKAPVGKVRGGTLRRSIHTPWRPGDLSTVVGSSVHYAAFVEFGTRYMAARPYLRPAYAAVMPGFAAAVKRALGALR